jgi:hypothetical protein
LVESHRQRTGSTLGYIWYDVNHDNTEKRFKTNVSLHTSTLKNGVDLLLQVTKVVKDFSLWDKVISSLDSSTTELLLKT